MRDIKITKLTKTWQKKQRSEKYLLYKYNKFFSFLNKKGDNKWWTMIIHIFRASGS